MPKYNLRLTETFLIGHAKEAIMSYLTAQLGRKNPQRWHEGALESYVPDSKPIYPKGIIEKAIKELIDEDKVKEAP